MSLLQLNDLPYFQLASPAAIVQGGLSPFLLDDEEPGTTRIVGRKPLSSRVSAQARSTSVSTTPGVTRSSQAGASLAIGDGVEDYSLLTSVQ